MTNPTQPAWEIHFAKDGRPGLGMIATHYIPAGTLFFTERPFITLLPVEYDTDATLLLALMNLDDDSKARLTKLSGTEKEPCLSNRFQTNSFTVDAKTTGSTEMKAVFEQALRVNHSCMPNALGTFKVDDRPCGDGTITAGVNSMPISHTPARPSINIQLRAVTAIEKGEEITVSYITTSNWPLTTTRKTLLEPWDFICTCRVCTDPPDERLSDGDGSSDGLRAWMNDFLSKVACSGSWQIGRKVQLCNTYVKKMEIELGGERKYEGETLTRFLDLRACDAYAMLGDALAEGGRWVEAVVWYRRERISRALLMGEEGKW